MKTEIKSDLEKKYDELFTFLKKRPKKFLLVVVLFLILILAKNFIFTLAETLASQWLGTKESRTIPTDTLSPCTSLTYAVSVENSSDITMNDVEAQGPCTGGVIISSTTNATATNIRVRP